MAYDSLERFLDHRPMDLVAIGSPSALHAEQGIAAAERGLHVLVEKPLDINDRQGRRADRRDRPRRRQAGRVLPGPPQARRRQVEGDASTPASLGRPILASGRVKWYRPPEYYGGSRWRGTFALDGGGALINQAIHTLDLMLHLWGPIVSVDARAGTQLHTIEVEDTVVATLQFENGALGVFEASTAVFPGYARRVELTGSNGTLTIEHDSLVGVDLKVPDPRFPSAPVGRARRRGGQRVVADRLGRHAAPAHHRGLPARDPHVGHGRPATDRKAAAASS